MQTVGSARLCGGSRTRADRRVQAFWLAETLPQGEFISPEGKIEGELKQKLLELRG